MIEVIQGKVHNLLRGDSVQETFHQQKQIHISILVLLKKLQYKDKESNTWRPLYFNTYHESNNDEFILKRTHFLFARNYDTMHANLSSTYYKEKLYSLRPIFFVLFEKSNFLREHHLLSCLPFKNV